MLNELLLRTGANEYMKHQTKHCQFIVSYHVRQMLHYI